MIGGARARLARRELIQHLDARRPLAASHRAPKHARVGGDAELSAAHSAEVNGYIRGELENSGFEVLTSESVQVAGQEPCAEPSCTGPMLEQAQAAFAVGAAIWRRSGVVQVAVVIRSRRAPRERER